MTRKLTLALAFSLAAACGSSTSNPAKPTLGATVTDRMGRAAVNTALTDPFDIDPKMTEDAHKDSYNASSDPTTWAGSFSTEIGTNLAILDGLDNNCGNQLAADKSKTTNAGRYGGLAAVLADDRLYLNTGGGTCQLYLGVEANATKLAANTDCGGRTPLENTVDETYQLIAAGTVCALSPGVCAISNGITVDAEGSANITTFPFLGSPN